MRALLVGLVLFSFMLPCKAQDSIGHFNAKDKEKVLGQMIIGSWVSTKDPNEKLVITKDTCNWTFSFNGKYTNQICNYSLRFIDSTMLDMPYDVDFSGWAGYCMLCGDNSFLSRIYSVSSKYLQLDNQEVYKKE